MHIRQQLKDKVTAAIASATGLTVYAYRTNTLQDSELPAILVAIESENVTPGGARRDMRLAVSVYDRATSGVDASLDAIAVDIENAMETVIISGGEVNLENTDIDIDNGDMQIATLTLTYSAVVYNVSDPEQII